jgi:hypothetical protein
LQLKEILEIQTKAYMRYPYYPHPNLFEPSIETLKLWLNTRKANTKKGVGLFETDRFNLDRNWFIVAFLFEIAAFVLTIWGGTLKYYGTKKFSILITALLASLFFVLLDYFGVLLHHRGKDDKVRAASQLNFTKDPIIIGALKKVAFSKFSWYQFFGFTCMLLSATLKIWSLIILISFFKKLAPIFVIFYLIVLYVHAKHTGYWYYAWKTDKLMTSEYHQYEKHMATNTPSEFSVKFPPHKIQFYSFYKFVGLGETLEKRVKINLVDTVLDNSQTKYLYEMSCIGILWDLDIVKITRDFNINFQQDLYEACVKMQHAQLGNPVALMAAPNNITLIDDESNA